jgi:hypothetical protein
MDDINNTKKKRVKTIRPVVSINFSVNYEYKNILLPVQNTDA